MILCIASKCSGKVQCVQIKLWECTGELTPGGTGYELGHLLSSPESEKNVRKKDDDNKY